MQTAKEKTLLINEFLKRYKCALAGAMGQANRQMRGREARESFGHMRFLAGTFVGYRDAMLLVESVIERMVREKNNPPTDPAKGG